MHRIALFTEPRCLQPLGSRALAYFRLGLNFEDGTSLDHLGQATHAPHQNMQVNRPVVYSWQNSSIILPTLTSATRVSLVPRTGIGAETKLLIYQWLVKGNMLSIVLTVAGPE